MSLGWSYTESISQSSKHGWHGPVTEAEHEMEVLVPQSEDGSDVTNDYTSPGCVRSSERDFWTRIRPVLLSTALV